MIKSNIRKISWIFILLLFALFILKPTVETVWSQWMGFVAMHSYNDRLKASWEEKSTSFLIGKLKHPSIAYSGAAASILARRGRDPKLETKLIDIVKSDFIFFIHAKAAALSVLFALDEQAAINLSMEILQSGEEHPLYTDALMHLSRRKYEPAYSYVLKLAEGPDPMATAAVKYLGDYGKLEAIPILEEMLTKIRTHDELVARIDRRRIVEAIAAIKEHNNISIQENGMKQ